MIHVFLTRGNDTTNVVPDGSFGSANILPP
jgi:hypothetical protein